MPEGDTIHRLASALRPMLVDGELLDVRLREHGPLEALAGERIESVEALGKHLLIGIAEGWTLRTHLGMYGDVHRYGPVERWKRPAIDAVLTLRTSDHVVIWFEPARAELLRTAHLSTHPILSRLGPDLLGPEVDFDQILIRARARARGRARPIGELLLDQRVACGIGNIYRNEVMFLEGVDPWARVDELADDEISALYRLARDLLSHNIRRGERSTRLGQTLLPGEPRHWVYGREHQRCLKCGAAIEIALQGDGARGTFFCPTCQQSS